MGAAASKTSSAVASSSRSRVIRTNVSLEQLIALSRGAVTELPAQTQVEAVEMSATPIDSHGSHVELMEMQTQLLDDVQKIEDFDRVKFLEESTRAFEATASSHRPRSSQPPMSWTHEVLADKYGLDIDTMRSILSSVGPPNVLPPRGTSEHPLGVWFNAPGELLAQSKEQETRP
ncbi:hypothetical protein GN244_ATG20401 [Phytophthora infestans]|uniref:Uncharacterized protein n=1 Tax=Phytophthora infestans TaxID=4787 RepID=A0A833RMP7_PHYIN|nr:hypothetical protein GN244_ATG20401 [Phytophthora infestans]